MKYLKQSLPKQSYLFIYQRESDQINSFGFLIPKARFFIRPAYRVFTAQIHNNIDIPWAKLWNLRALEKVKMLLWRIGSNALPPTKENLIQRIGSIDPTCVLCNQENETGPHMFFKCPIARAIWYLGCWGFRSEDHHLHRCEDIIKIIPNPPKASCPTDGEWLIPLNMTFVINEIWYLRNQVLNQSAEINIEESIRRVRYKL